MCPKEPEENPDEESCLRMQYLCLMNPKQPARNRKIYGKYKDCGACFSECIKEKGWPFYKCPFDDGPLNY